MVKGDGIAEIGERREGMKSYKSVCSEEQGRELERSIDQGLKHLTDCLERDTVCASVRSDSVICPRIDELLLRRWKKLHALHGDIH